MQRYISYWRRGWWAWLLAACFNLTAVPVTWAGQSIAREHLFAYSLAVLLSWNLVFAPLWGWLFEVFATNSTRIAARAADGASDGRVGDPS